MNSTGHTVRRQPPRPTDRVHGQVRILPVALRSHYEMGQLIWDEIRFLFGPPGNVDPEGGTTRDELLVLATAVSRAKEYLQGQGWPKPRVDLHCGGQILALGFHMRVPAAVLDSLVNEIVAVVSAKQGTTR